MRDTALQRAVRGEEIMVKNDRTREDEWFSRNEKSLIEAARVAREKRERDRAKREQVDELKRLKELHYLHCPKCGHGMKSEKMRGITIERCGFCEGMFFDAGEIEQLFIKRDEERRSLLARLLKL
jgi:rubrerythrin